MFMHKKILLYSLLLGVGQQVFAQTTQMKIAHNAVGKLQASIAKKEEVKNQLNILGEGIKAVESAENDRKTKNWPETWAIKSYLSSYIAILDENEGNSEKYYGLASSALDKAKSLDRYQDNSGLIAASTYNINIKKLMLGKKYYEQKDFINAYNSLKEVSDFMPQDTAIAINTAIAAQNIQKYNEALDYFKKAKENGVKNPLVFQQMATIYASKFDADAAISTLEEGLKINPFHPNLTNDYINILLDNERFDKALKTIEQVINTDKNNKLLYYLFGYLQQEKFNNIGAAEAAYQKTLSLDQNYFSALYQLGLAYLDNATTALKAKDNAKFVSAINRAELSFLKAHEINPNDRNTIQLLIEIYTRKNKLDKVQDLKRKLNEF